MPSMLPYGLVAILCGVGIVACFILALCDAAKEGDELVEELFREHDEAAREQADAFLDAVRDIAADCLKPEVGSVEWCESLHGLDAREPVR